MFSLTDRGQHIHHAYFLSPTDTKETGQVNLINLLLSISNLTPASTVLDVGCGIGGTSRHLARHQGCTVTGITISGRQVQIARRLTADEDASRKPDESTTAAAPEEAATTDAADGFSSLGPNGGKVQYLELDAEKMGSRFEPETFDAVWISEALSHFPDKALFFRNAARVLRAPGKLVIADWFKNDGLSDEVVERDIRPIEGTSLRDWNGLMLRNATWF